MTLVLWCRVCGSSHSKPVDCPGELRATGPERHGWRIAVETPVGIEAYGILVAPSYDVFRARVLTYPNMLWTTPGGYATIKFVGRTAQEAEVQAVAFVEGHVRALGYKVHSAPDVERVMGFNPEAAPGRQSVLPAPRKLRAVPIRFANGVTLFSAMTVNLSESGMFVNTMAPIDSGLAVRIHVDLETGGVGMRGEVVWNRTRPVMGRPVGMGVRLVTPPEGYVEFVREIL